MQWQSPKVQTKTSKHEFAYFGHGMPKLDAALGQMPTGDVNLGAADRLLELSRGTFRAVDVHGAVRPFLSAVIHGPMLILWLRESTIGVKLVRGGLSPTLDLTEALALQGRASHIRDNTHHGIPATLQRRKDSGLARRSAATFPTATAAADLGLIRIDMAGVIVVTGNNAHVLVDYMAYTPGRRMAHAELALKLLRGDAAARHGE